MSVRARWFAAVGALVLLVVGGACIALRSLGAASSRPAADFGAQASPAARELARRAFEGLDPARILDHHAHLAGIGTDGSGCGVDERVFSWLHPKKRVQFLFYLDAAGVRERAHADREMVQRLSELCARSPVPLRCALLAFDHACGPDGSLDAEHSELYVPNEWTARIAAEDPAHFLAACSVHPHRPDALAELARCAARGQKLVKWLPNSMGIDPADPRCDAFYAALVAHGMTLLVHTGEEQAVDGGAAQQYGNPLRLRRALERGVRVIAAHCGSLGEGEDLDRPGHQAQSNFDLWLRLMGETHPGELWGDISAVSFRNRDERVLRTLLERTDLHARLLYGSDWPLPALRVLVGSARLEELGFLTHAERLALDEIYDFNPLLADFALKRTLHGAHGERFAERVFQAREWLVPRP